MEMPKELVIQKLEKQVKSLQYDCAELQKHNDELAERVKKLASKTPVHLKVINQEGLYLDHQTDIVPRGTNEEP